MAIIKRLTSTKITFRKLAMGAAIAGLVAVPSFVAAESSGSTSANTATTASTTTSTTPATTTSGTSGTTVIATPITGTSGDTSTGTSTSTGTTTTNGTVTTSTGSTVPTTSSTTSSTSVTFQQAVDTAQSTFSTKTIVKAALLDSRSASPVYMVVFSDGSRVIIDANSGSVVYSFDTATQTATGTNPFGGKERDSDSDDSDSVGGLPASRASVTAHTTSNARGPQGFERRER